MSIKLLKLVELKCNICRLSENLTLDSYQNSGWLEISLKSEYSENIFDDFHLCPGCRKIIRMAETFKTAKEIKKEKETQN